MAFEFKLPDIGEGIHEGEIVQWLVNVGDTVAEDQPVLEVMTDKVTAEIPSPVSGTVKELRGKPGEVIQVGAVIVVIEEGAAGAAPKKEGAESRPQPEVSSSAQNTSAAVPTAVPEKATAPVSANQLPDISNGGQSAVATVAPSRATGKVLAAPATRRLARQLGVDLSMITGTGPRGRVTPNDIKQWQAGGGAQQLTPGVSSRPTGGQLVSRGETRKPFAGMRRKIAEHLVKSKQTAPHFGYVEEVDMTRLVALREELLPMAESQGVKLSFLPFVVKAVIEGLKAYPVLNAQLDEAAGEIILKNDYHIGIAVATDNGLIVPVIKHADQKSLFTIAKEISELAGKARNNKLALDELKGGTFTITSIGSIGGIFSVPIINYPEVGIMGINKIEKRPVVRDNEIVIRDMMYLSLSGDHRVVDGAEAALFTKHVIGQLESPSGLLLKEML